MAIKVIREKEPGPGTLGKPELYALAIGQVIGAEGARTQVAFHARDFHVC